MTPPFWAPSRVTGPVADASVPLPVLPRWPVAKSLPLFDDDPSPPHAPRISAAAAERARAEETRMGTPFRDHARRSECAGTEASDRRESRGGRWSRIGHDRRHA